MDHGQNVYGEHTYFPQGHRIFYVFRFPNFSGTLPSSLSKTIDFPCTELQNSWVFRVEFRVAPANGSVSPIVYIKRTDTNGGPLRVTFFMQRFVNPPSNFPALRPPVDLTQAGVLPGREISRSFPGFINREDLIQMTGKLVNIQIAIFVQGCHNEDYTKRKPAFEASDAPPKLKMLFSKI